MYLLDTDIIILVLRGQQKYLDLLEELSSQGTPYISTITIAEVYKNVYPQELIKTERLLNNLGIYDVTSIIAKQAGLYWQEYSKNLKNLNITDCLIAATANVNEVTLVSLNIRHFPMKDIKFLDPK